MTQMPLGSDRLTITLAPGQRDALRKIAKQYGAGLAYVVCLALARFIEDANHGQLQLPFHSLSQGRKESD